jgi:hypothetical protein
MAEKVYAKGIWFNHKHEKQPEFVIGSVSISKKTFMEWLEAQQENEKGYVKLQLLEGKENPYFTLDTYKKLEKPEALKEVDPAAIPF